MKTLRGRFNLFLSIALIIATLFPILVLYWLGESGLVEATYVTQNWNPEQDDWLLTTLLRETLPIRPDRDLPPLSENPHADEWPLRVSVTDPQTGQPRLNLIFDPITGLWTKEQPAENIERIVVASNIFHFRVDLPAWIAIGTLPLLGLLLGFVLSLVMSRSVTRPLSQLVEATRAIGQRELGYRVETRGSQELVDLAQSFNRMAEQLEQAETNRRNLMADVAHELRTPLAVLDGNLRALLDGVHDLNETEIALLYEQTRHLNRLVDDLRELSLAEAGQLSLQLQEVDLARLVRESVAHFDLAAQEGGIEFRAGFDEPLLHSELDENRLRQILHNLLANAFRHTPRGGSVAVSAKQLTGEETVEITISDTGAGIAPEELPHIFDRFYRTGAVIRRDRNGSGLGLAIVKALVDVLGDTIHAKSGGKGQGGRFGSVFRLKPWETALI